MSRLDATEPLCARHDNAIEVLVGGEDIGHREIYWNFVHSSKDRIEAAKQQWREMKFAPVPGDDEFIPLPL